MQGGWTDGAKLGLDSSLGGMSKINKKSQYEICVNSEYGMEERMRFWI